MEDGMETPLKIRNKTTTAAAAAKSLQLHPTLCDPIDGSPPGSPVPGILQARTLEWVAISFSNAWKWREGEVAQLCPTLATPWTAAYQAPPSMGFSKQKYWSGAPLPSLKTTTWPSNPTPRHIPWGNQNWKRHMYPIVHCSSIYNS